MKRFLAAVVAVVASSPVVAQPVPGTSAPGLTLHLVCRGIGDHEVRHGSVGTIFGRHGGVATGFGSTGEQDQFGEQMDINIEGANATTRVPRRFLPPLHGGNGGMFDIKDMVVTEDTITGTVLINVTNHPKLRIDRRTGAVDLDGKVGSYSGECKPYDAVTAPRAF
jgi:hypothetical protein